MSNLTQNQMLDGLVTTATVYRPDGGVLWSQTATLAQLPPAASKDSSYGVNLAMAAAGAYRAALAVKDSAGTTLAQAETAFTVGSTGDTGSGLKGSVAVASKQVAQGDPLSIGSTVTNLGNAAVTALPMALSIVDPASQAIVASWAFTADIAAGGSYQHAQTWASVSGKADAVYMAVLTATVGGKPLTLGYDTFTITESPVKLDVKQQILREGRLLVLLTCRNGEGGGHEFSIGPDRQSTEKQDGDGAQDDDGQDDKSCLTGRAQIMGSALDTLGIAHRISTAQADFKKAFRSGQYNLYWLSGGADKLGDTLAREIREAVHRGDGLVVEGAHDERNKLLDEIAGVTYRGKLAGANQPVILDGLIYPGGKVAETLGQALKFKLDGGIRQARFLVNLPCHDCEGGEGYDSDSPPAIVSNSYGKGKSLVAAFDFMGTLPNTPVNNATWQEIARATLGYLVPVVPESYSGGAYAVARTTLANLGKAVKLEAIGTLPAGAHVVATRPGAQTDSQGSQAKWAFDLGAGQSADLDLALRLPGSSGSHTLTTVVNRIDNGLSVSYGSYPLTFLVSVATEPANRAKLIADLQALDLKAKRDREARDQAVKLLLESGRDLGQGKVEDAIDKLLDAADKLRSIAATDAAAADLGALRLQIDRLLQETEFIWQPPAQKTGGKTATANIGSR